MVWFTRREDGWGTVHNWPSNFFIEEDGSCVEVEFQVKKHEGYPWRQVALRKMRPAQAKKYGRQWKLTPLQIREWDEIKYEVMKELIEQKLRDWPEIALALETTGDGNLVEENWWHDDEWGHCICRRHFYRIGRNLLGKIWMELRDDIRRGRIDLDLAA